MHAWNYLPYPPPKKFPESYTINTLLSELVNSRWLDIGLILFFASLWTLTLSWSTNMQKRTWPISSHLLPQTWSITHMHYIRLNFSYIPNMFCLVTGFHCTDNENYIIATVKRLRWLIHIINLVDKTQLSRYTSHRRSTTVSLETYPSNENYSCTSIAELKISGPPRRPKNGANQHFSVKILSPRRN